MISLLSQYSKNNSSINNIPPNNSKNENASSQNKLREMYSKVVAKNGQNVTSKLVKNNIIEENVDNDETDSSSFVTSSNNDETNFNNSSAVINNKNVSNNEKRLENLKKAREAHSNNKKKHDELINISKISDKKSAFTKNENFENQGRKNVIFAKTTNVNSLNTKKNTTRENIKEEYEQKINNNDARIDNEDNETKKSYKRKTKLDKFKLWNKDCYFVSIDPPSKLPDTSKTRYKITFKYFCDNDKKIKRKTMFFGQKNIEYLVDHGDEDKNRLWLSKQRGYYTPFHKNFWINCLLCSEKNMLKAYNKAIEQLIHEL
jgi:hypothetical protein